MENFIDTIKALVVILLLGKILQYMYVQVIIWESTTGHIPTHTKLVLGFFAIAGVVLLIYFFWSWILDYFKRNY